MIAREEVEKLLMNARRGYLKAESPDALNRERVLADGEGFQQKVPALIGHGPLDQDPSDIQPDDSQWQGLSVLRGGGFDDAVLFPLIADESGVYIGDFQRRKRIAVRGRQRRNSQERKQNGKRQTCLHGFWGLTTTWLLVFESFGLPRVAPVAIVRCHWCASGAVGYPLPPTFPGASPGG